MEENGFVVTVTTGPLENENSNIGPASLHVCLVGELAESEYVRVGEANADVEIVAVINLGVDIGEVKHVLIGHDDEDGLGVFIRSVTVIAQKTATEYSFLSDFWLKDDPSPTPQTFRAMRLAALQPRKISPRSLAIARASALGLDNDDMYDDGTGQTEGALGAPTARTNDGRGSVGGQSDVSRFGLGGNTDRNNNNNNTNSKGGSHEYIVDIGTGAQRNATVPIDVLITIIGSSEDSGDVVVARANPATPMEAVATLECSHHLGAVQSVLVGLRPLGGAKKGKPLPDLFIEKLHLFDATASKSYHFGAQCWVQDEDPEPTAVELIPLRVEQVKDRPQWTALHKAAVAGGYAVPDGVLQAESEKARKEANATRWGLAQLFPESKSFDVKDIMSKRFNASSRGVSFIAGSGADPSSPSNPYGGFESSRSGGGATTPGGGAGGSYFDGDQGGGGGGDWDGGLKMVRKGLDGNRGCSAALLRAGRRHVAVLDSGRLEGYGVPSSQLEDDIILLMESSNLLLPPPDFPLSEAEPPEFRPDLSFYTYSYEVEVDVGMIRNALPTTALVICLVGSKGESGDWEVGTLQGGSLTLKTTIMLSSSIENISQIIVGLAGADPLGLTAAYIERASVKDCHRAIKSEAAAQFWLQANPDDDSEACALLSIINEELDGTPEHPEEHEREVAVCRLRGLTRAETAVRATDFVEWCADVEAKSAIWLQPLNASWNDSGTSVNIAVAVSIHPLVTRSAAGRVICSGASRCLAVNRLRFLVFLVKMVMSRTRARNARNIFGAVVAAGRTIGSSVRRFWLRTAYRAEYWAGGILDSRIRAVHQRRKYARMLQAGIFLCGSAARRGEQRFRGQMGVLPWALRRTTQSRVWLDHKLMRLLDGRQVCAQILQYAARRAIPHTRYIRVLQASQVILASVLRCLNAMTLIHSEQHWAAVTLASFVRRSIVEYSHTIRGYEEIESPSPEARKRLGLLVISYLRRKKAVLAFYNARFEKIIAADVLRGMMLRKIDRRRYLDSEVSADLLFQGKNLRKRPLSALLALARVEGLLGPNAGPMSSSILAPTSLTSLWKGPPPAQEAPNKPSRGGPKQQQQQQQQQDSGEIVPQISLQITMRPLGKPGPLVQEPQVTSKFPQRSTTRVVRSSTSSGLPVQSPVLARPSVSPSASPFGALRASTGTSVAAAAAITAVAVAANAITPNSSFDAQATVATVEGEGGSSSMSVLASTTESLVPPPTINAPSRSSPPTRYAANNSNNNARVGPGGFALRNNNNNNLNNNEISPPPPAAVSRYAGLNRVGAPGAAASAARLAKKQDDSDQLNNSGSRSSSIPPPAASVIRRRPPPNIPDKTSSTSTRIRSSMDNDNNNNDSSSSSQQKSKTDVKVVLPSLRPEQVQHVGTDGEDDSAPTSAERRRAARLAKRAQSQMEKLPPASTLAVEVADRSAVSDGEDGGGGLKRSKSPKKKKTVKKTGGAKKDKLKKVRSSNDTGLGEGGENDIAAKNWALHNEYITRLAKSIEEHLEKSIQGGGGGAGGFAAAASANPFFAGYVPQELRQYRPKPTYANESGRNVILPSVGKRTKKVKPAWATLPSDTAADELENSGGGGLKASGSGRNAAVATHLANAASARLMAQGYGRGTPDEESHGY